MRAVAVFPSERAVRLIDAPRPRIERPTEALLRVLEVGVCGTDREICSFAYGFPPTGSDHLVIGHEALAEVVEIGPSVTAVRPGDLVTITVRRPCNEPGCEACKIGRQDFCYSGRFVERGIKERHGYMTEYVVDDERYLVPVPRSLREVAVLIEPLTIAEKALLQVWTVQQRLPWSCPHAPNHQPGQCHHAVVLGAGPIGLLGAMAFRAAGFTTFVYSREPEGSERARLVESFDAHYISSQSTPVDRLLDRVGTIDVVYEATGASRMCFEVLQQLGPNAAFIFTGVPGLHGKGEIDTDRIMRTMVLRNQVLFGTVNAGREAFDNAVRDLGIFMERWPKATRALITARHPVEQFETPLSSREGVKHVIQFN